MAKQKKLSIDCQKLVEKGICKRPGCDRAPGASCPLEDRREPRSRRSKL